MRLEPSTTGVTAATTPSFDPPPERLTPEQAALVLAAYLSRKTAMTQAAWMELATRGRTLRDDAAYQAMAWQASRSKQLARPMAGERKAS